MCIVPAAWALFVLGQIQRGSEGPFEPPFDPKRKVDPFSEGVGVQENTQRATKLFDL